MKVFRDFCARGKFGRSLNATLISKISRVVDLKDFLSISLVWHLLSKL
jgi:hypothetical protein